MPTSEASEESLCKPRSRLSVANQLNQCVAGLSDAPTMSKLSMPMEISLSVAEKSAQGEAGCNSGSSVEMR